MHIRYLLIRERFMQAANSLMLEATQTVTTLPNMMDTTGPLSVDQGAVCHPRDQSIRLSML